jgi:hypothetical protein
MLCLMDQYGSITQAYLWKKILAMLLQTQERCDELVQT